MPPSSKSKALRKRARFTPALHERFRRAVNKIRSQRSPRFVASRKAYVRRKQVFKGAHGLVEKAFGSLKSLIYAAGGCERNATRSRTATSRGSRIGRELCSIAKNGPAAEPKKKKKKDHEWTPAVATALRRWNIHLLAGEVPVCYRYVATGIDLLGVTPHPTRAGKWQLVCVELKTGYKGPVWKSTVKGVTTGGVPKSVLNYALTQAQITQMCAQATFHEFEFAEPRVVLVNDDGVSCFRPSEAIIQQAKSLLSE